MINEYSGAAKLNRSFHLAYNAATEERKHQAKLYLNRELLLSKNTAFYYKHLEEFKGVEFEEWAKSVDESITAESATLEARLLNAKSSAIKESIRQIYNELGLLHEKWGKSTESLKYFLRSRDYCTTPQHHVDCALQIIVSSINSDQRYNASSFVNKVCELTNDPGTIGKMSIISGVLAMMDKQYTVACAKFLSCEYFVGNEISEIITSKDVVLYSVVSFFIVLTRLRLTEVLASNKLFVKNYLNLDSQLKTFVTEIGSGKFHETSKILSILKTKLQEDLYLCTHADEITALILDQFLVQYLEPYELIALPQIAESFGLPQEVIENRLIELISSGKLMAKIDSERELVMQTNIDERKQILGNCKAVVDMNSTNNLHSVLRCNAYIDDLVVGKKPDFIKRLCIEHEMDTPLEMEPNF